MTNEKPYIARMLRWPPGTWLGWKLEFIAFGIAFICAIIGTIIICSYRGYW